MLYYPPFTKRNRRIDMKIKRYIKQRAKEVTEHRDDPHGPSPTTNQITQNAQWPVLGLVIC